MCTTCYTIILTSESRSRYDNACHLLDYCLARDPHLLQLVRFYVDKFHHKGHKSCSPYMSHAADPGTKFMNSSVMEQGNRYSLVRVLVSPGHCDASHHSCNLQVTTRSCAVHCNTSRTRPRSSPSHGAGYPPHCLSVAFCAQGHTVHVCLTTGLVFLRFLVLLRHVVWMHTTRQHAVPPLVLGDRAWVFDGVGVALARRHQYTSGRPHTARPLMSRTRLRVHTSFRDRLMIAEPKLRAALRQLLSSGDLGVVCTQDVRRLSEWLQDDSSTGGLHLRPYVRLVMVCSALAPRV